MHNYYRIKNQVIGDSAAAFSVELLPDCPVYAGHFPGNPIAPGACNIEMVRECACIALGREMRIAEIKVCKFLMLIQPQHQKELTVQLSWNGLDCSAVIVADERKAVQLKMRLV